MALTHGSAGGRSGDGEVHRITAAPRSHEDDLHPRVVKYLVSMSIRMVCLVLAFVVTGPMRWVFVAGAVILPYVAVVMANAGREPHDAPPEAPSVQPMGHIAPSPMPPVDPDRIWRAEDPPPGGPPGRVDDDPPGRTSDE